MSSARRIVVHGTPRYASPWLLFTIAGLGGLLGYMLARQVVEPGFTDYWGFIVAQIAGTLVAVLATTIWLSPRGALSWYTLLVVTANTWADTLGTAGHLYERHASYDKVTHFLAGVAIAAAAADILRALDERGVIRLRLASQLLAAVAVTIVVNVGWEAYEYVGDVVFQGERHRGARDTGYDFVSDLSGALMSVLVLWRLRLERAPGRPPLSSSRVLLEPQAAAPDERQRA